MKMRKTSLYIETVRIKRLENKRKKKKTFYQDEEAMVAVNAVTQQCAAAAARASANRMIMIANMIKKEYTRRLLITHFYPTHYPYG